MTPQSDPAAWPDVLSAIGSLAAAVAAIGAWRAAAKSNSTAETVKTIEQRRWHAELTPQFNVTCQAAPADRAELRVDLAGPLPLGELDELTVTIRDDGRCHPPSGKLTQADIDATIWGPYKLIPHVDGADDTGRQAKVAALPVGNGRPFSLERTVAPPWSEAGWWRRQYADEPVRLMLHCVRYGFEPWAIPIEVPVGLAESST